MSDLQQTGNPIRNWVCPICNYATDEQGELSQPFEPSPSSRQMTRDQVIQDQGGRGLPPGQFHPPGDPRRTQGGVVHDASSREWLMETGPGEGVDVDPVLMAKLAGKDFSPREQREFITEEGEARNLDKLDLDGTHYVTDDEVELAFNW